VQCSGVESSRVISILLELWSGVEWSGVEWNGVIVLTELWLKWSDDILRFVRGWEWSGML
jgi:hypothetical protein